MLVTLRYLLGPSCPLCHFSRMSDFSVSYTSIVFRRTDSHGFLNARGLGKFGRIFSRTKYRSIQNDLKLGFFKRSIKLDAENKTPIRTTYSLLVHNSSRRSNVFTK